MSHHFSQSLNLGGNSQGLVKGKERHVSPFLHPRFALDLVLNKLEKIAVGQSKIVLQQSELSMQQSDIVSQQSEFAFNQTSSYSVLTTYRLPT